MCTEVKGNAIHVNLKISVILIIQKSISCLIISSMCLLFVSFYLSRSRILLSNKKFLNVTTFYNINKTVAHEKEPMRFLTSFFIKT